MLAELNDGTVRTLFLVFLNLLNFHVELTLSFSLREMFLPYCAFLVVRSNYWSHDSLSYLTCTRFQSQVSCLPKKRGFFRFASAFSNCFDKTPSFSFFFFFLPQLFMRKNQSSFRSESSSNSSSLR